LRSSKRFIRSGRGGINPAAIIFHLAPIVSLASEFAAQAMLSFLAACKYFRPGISRPEFLKADDRFWTASGAETQNP
jgi:hypothetical protein